MNCIQAAPTGKGFPLAPPPWKPGAFLPAS
jgi:hypothetical protein